MTPPTKGSALLATVVFGVASTSGGRQGCGREEVVVLHSKIQPVLCVCSRISSRTPEEPPRFACLENQSPCWLPKPLLYVPGLCRREGAL